MRAIIIFSLYHTLSVPPMRQTYLQAPAQSLGRHMTPVLCCWILSVQLLLFSMPCSIRAEDATHLSTSFDHYQSAELNRAALDAIRHGDTMTALILLERAVRLAPQDKSLQHNLTELRADTQQEPLRGPKATSLPIVNDPPAPPAVPPPTMPLLPSPPSLWEKKPPH